jgi:galactose mutarotase-like enzyme
VIRAKCAESVVAANTDSNEKVSSAKSKKRDFGSIYLESEAIKLKLDTDRLALDEKNADRDHEFKLKTHNEDIASRNQARLDDVESKSKLSAEETKRAIILQGMQLDWSEERIKNLLASVNSKPN